MKKTNLVTDLFFPTLIISIALALVMAASKAEAKSTNVYLQEVESEIDMLCGDTWCEGDINLLEVKAIYQKSTGTLRVYMAHQEWDNVGPIFYSVCVMPFTDLEPRIVADIVNMTDCSANHSGRTELTVKDISDYYKERGE